VIVTTERHTVRNQDKEKGAFVRHRVDGPRTKGTRRLVRVRKNSCNFGLHEAVNATTSGEAKLSDVLGIQRPPSCQESDHPH
jgi:hypothetical protein